MRRIPDEQESEVTVSLHMEVDQPNSTTTHTCAPVHILTEAHRDIAIPSPSYTHTHTQEILAEKKRKIMLFAQWTCNYSLTSCSEIILDLKLFAPVSPWGQSKVLSNWFSLWLRNRLQSVLWKDKPKAEWTTSQVWWLTLKSCTGSRPQQCKTKKASLCCVSRICRHI